MKKQSKMILKIFYIVFGQIACKEVSVEISVVGKISVLTPT